MGGWDDGSAPGTVATEDKGCGTPCELHAAMRQMSGQRVVPAVEN